MQDVVIPPTFSSSSKKYDSTKEEGEYDDDGIEDTGIVQSENIATAMDRYV